MAVRSCVGFTLVELMLVIAIMATLFGIVFPSYTASVNQARLLKTTSALRQIGSDINVFELLNGRFPNTLAEAGLATRTDPWGRPYQYLNFSQGGAPGKRRKDKNLVPINSTFDLYSLGPDGISQPPLTAKASQDDIVWANDGDFIGPAWSY